MEKVTKKEVRKIDRFDIYRKYRGLNDNQVSVALGIEGSTIGKSRGKNRDISARVIAKILNVYKDINPDWLMLGKGEMLRPIVQNQPTQTAIGDGNSQTCGNVYNGDSSVRIAVLEAENEGLKKQLEEKERLIQVLLTQHQTNV